MIEEYSPKGMKNSSWEVTVHCASWGSFCLQKAILALIITFRSELKQKITLNFE